MNIWVYQSRKGEIRLFKGFEDARVAQDRDNRCTVEECEDIGLEIGGSEDSGHFYIDDGGSIDLVEVE